MPGFRSRGLLARILYSLPANLVGRRQIGTPPVPEDVRDVYGGSVRSLVLTMAEWTDPAVLQLTPEAAELILDAERRLEPRLDPEPATWPASSTGQASRSARPSVSRPCCTSPATHDGWGARSARDTMRAALAVMDYYSAHALAAFDHMGVDQALDDARAVYRWLERTGPQRFTKREALHGLSRSRFPKVGDLDAPLELLEQHGWIRRMPEPERTGPGRQAVAVLRSPPRPCHRNHVIHVMSDSVYSVVSVAPIGRIGQ